LDRERFEGGSDIENGGIRVIDNLYNIQYEEGINISMLHALHVTGGEKKDTATQSSATYRCSWQEEDEAKRSELHEDRANSAITEEEVRVARADKNWW